MPDIECSTTGIQKILTYLNIKKAPGPDGITARYLKELAPIVATCLQRIFSKCYLTGETPKDWRQANICPIFKKGERYTASNYRPVSLTSIISKVMQHCIVSNMFSHLEDNHILYPNQHGFRSRLSTETQLVTFVDELTPAVTCRGRVDAIILDFSKAFDKVCHKCLLYKYCRTME